MLKIDFAIDTKDLETQIMRNLLESGVERLDEIARVWGIPAKFLIIEDDARSLVETNCYTCAFRFFIHSGTPGCFATKLAGTPLKLPTRFRDEKIPDEKPTWCPLNRIFITVIDD